MIFYFLTSNPNDAEFQICKKKMVNVRRRTLCYPFIFFFTYHLHGLGDLLNVGDRLEPEPDKLQVGHFVFTLDAYSETWKFVILRLHYLSSMNFLKNPFSLCNTTNSVRSFIQNMIIWQVSYLLVSSNFSYQNS